MATSQKDRTIIIDLELLNSGNAQGCPACHRKFSLGDIAVMACGFWETGPEMCDLRVRLVKEYQLGGVMVWEFGHDTDDPKQSLLRHLSKGMELTAPADSRD